MYTACHRSVYYLLTRTEIEDEVYNVCVCVLQLGQAVTKNPGYLKLRRIRAAQNIAKTVRLELLTSSMFNVLDQSGCIQVVKESVTCVLYRFRLHRIEFT